MPFAKVKREHQVNLPGDRYNAQPGSGTAMVKEIIHKDGTGHSGKEGVIIRLLITECEPTKFSSGAPSGLAKGTFMDVPLVCDAPHPGAQKLTYPQQKTIQRAGAFLKCMAMSMESYEYVKPENVDKNELTEEQKLLDGDEEMLGGFTDALVGFVNREIDKKNKDGEPIVVTDLIPVDGIPF